MPRGAVRRRAARPRALRAQACSPSRGEARCARVESPRGSDAVSRPAARGPRRPPDRQHPLRPRVRGLPPNGRARRRRPSRVPTGGTRARGGRARVHRRAARRQRPRVAARPSRWSRQRTARRAAPDPCSQAGVRLRPHDASLLRGQLPKRRRPRRDRVRCGASRSFFDSLEAPVRTTTRAARRPPSTNSQCA